MSRGTAVAEALGTSSQSRVGWSDLVDWFTPDGTRPRRYGVEVECGLVRPDSGVSVTYEGERGCRAVLEGILNQVGGVPMIEGTSVIGVEFPDEGSAFTLEMGGAIEFSSGPTTSLTEAVEQARCRLTQAAQIAHRLGIAVLAGSYLPFESMADVKWAPKPRTKIMRRHFGRLGDDGSMADAVMGLTLSVQVSLDASTEREYLEKLRTLLMASPFLAALLVHSPELTGAADRGVDSMRMTCWQRIDPSRCQGLSRRLLGVESIGELVELLASLPMIYRPVERGRYVAAPAVPFADLMSRGFPGGSYPTIDDWKSHLGQIWPSVRPRRTLETRLPDGQVWQDVATVPAMFVGLTEDASVRRAVLDLLGSVDGAVLDSITVRAAAQGVQGMSPMNREVAAELVRLAHEGLLARIATGVEKATIRDALAPLQEVVSTGVTPAEKIRKNWSGVWKRNPAAYVNHMAVPTVD